MRRVTAAAALVALMGASSCSGGLSEAESEWCGANTVVVGHTGFVLGLAIRTTDETVGEVSLYQGGRDAISGEVVFYAFLDEADFEEVCRAAYEDR